MSKDDQSVIVVERDLLFGDDYFEGFSGSENVDYEKRILSNLKTMRRRDAEQDPTHKQPIGYAIIINPFLRRVFAYQRSSKDAEYGEKRLQGKWSWGFGGHIESHDTIDGNLIRDSVLREVTQEELEIFGNLTFPKAIGYINDDSNDVGRVHFGILYLLSTHSQHAQPKDSEIARVELKGIYDLEKMCSSPDFNVEPWSRIALEPLRKLLLNLGK